MVGMAQLMMENTELKQKYMGIQNRFRNLEVYNNELKVKVDELENKIQLLEGWGDIYEIMAKVEYLEIQNRNLQEEIKKRRKADGRPQKISWQTRDLIRQNRLDGWSIQALADAFHCSKTTIQKICSGIDIDLRRRSDKKETT